MNLPSKDFIESAIKDPTWDLMNKTLYDLCQAVKGHEKADDAISKICLIGRSYSASIERRKENLELKGDAFYKQKIGDKVFRGKIDDIFNEIRRSNDRSSEFLSNKHCDLTDLFHEISGENKISLASKYLHFHFPDDFYIYDGIASKSLRSISGDKLKTCPSYKNFYDYCVSLKNDIEAVYGRTIQLSPRDLDKILLANKIDEES